VKYNLLKFTCNCFYNLYGDVFLAVLTLTNIVSVNSLTVCA